jgi:glycerol kinase
VHATDPTNASRTLLYDIDQMQWSNDLCALFGIPMAMLPEVRPSSGSFGDTRADIFGASVPIMGVAGDQQAALFGQGCWAAGSAKNTYGTGAFLLLNTGRQRPRGGGGILTTVACDARGGPAYALEGAIFIAGAAVQWLRDALHLVHSAGETEPLARSIEDSQGVYLVPAFTGLGAPYWDPQARGALLGLTRDTGIAQIVRAALEAMGYQTRDLMRAMAQDAVVPTELRVDGGMVVNDWLTQNLADMLQLPVMRPQIVETTALGAAYLAGLQAGVYSSLDDIARLWQAEHRFTPQMPQARADTLYAGWEDAVRRVRSNY